MSPSSATRLHNLEKVVIGHEWARVMWLTIIAVAVLFVDQASKSLAVTNLVPGVAKHIAGPLSFQLMYNTGLVSSPGSVSHGVASTAPLVTELIACFLVIVFVLFTRGGTDRASSLGMGLLLGGGLGNLTDRLFRPGGSAIDFIQLQIVHVDI